MNQFWQENFGYGIDKLTQSEAGHLTSDVPRLLTRSEIASLRRDMKESGDWADKELERRYAQKEAKS